MANRRTNIETIGHDYDIFIQSHYIEVAQGDIFMEQKMWFGLDQINFVFKPLNIQSLTYTTHSRHHGIFCMSPPIILFCIQQLRRLAVAERRRSWETTTCVGRGRENSTLFPQIGLSNLRVPFNLSTLCTVLGTKVIVHKSCIELFLFLQWSTTCTFDQSLWNRTIHLNIILQFLSILTYDR